MNESNEQTMGREKYFVFFSRYGMLRTTEAENSKTQTIMIITIVIIIIIIKIIMNQWNEWTMNDYGSK